MIAAGRLAFANVRARARAARLLGPAAAAHLRAAREGPAREAALRAVGVEVGAADSPPSVARAPRGRLRGPREELPRRGGFVTALARLHEIENLKLVYRAVARGVPAERWRSLWRPMGRLGTLRLEEAVEARSFGDLEAAAARTPYAEAVAGAAGAVSPEAVEGLLDRLGSRALLDRARALPRAHADAAALVLSVLRERDLDAVRRAAAYGIAPEAAAGVAVLLPDEPGWGRLAALAAWTPAEGPIGLLLPRRLLGREVPVADWDALEHALRRRRRSACAAAFIGSPLRLAPGVAYLLLAEEEARGLSALVEGAGDGASGVVARALAGSALGD